MVTNVTNLSRTGLSDWLIQRISSVILAAYFLFIFGYIATHPDLDFDPWSYLFSNTWVRMFSFLALLSLVLHSWVGVWTVLTDYIKSVYLRLILQIGVILLLIFCLAWGIQIIWSL